MRLDKETTEVLKKGAKALRITEMQEWKELRRSFFEKIFELEQINSVALNDSDERIGSNVKANKKAANVLRAFINEVEGSAKGHETNEELLDSYKNSSFEYDE